MAKLRIEKDLLMLLNGIKKLNSAATDINSSTVSRLWLNSSLRLLSEKSLSLSKSVLTVSTALSQTEVSKNLSDSLERLSIVGKNVGAFVSRVKGENSPDISLQMESSKSELYIGDFFKSHSSKANTLHLRKNFIYNTYEKERCNNSLKNLDILKPYVVSSASNTLFHSTDRNENKFKRKLEDSQPIIKESKNLKAVSKYQTETINQKLLELHGLEYIQDFKVFEEVKAPRIKNNDFLKMNLSQDKQSHSDEIMQLNSHKNMQIFAEDPERETNKAKPNLLGSKPLAKSKAKSTLSSDAQARKVPQTRISRLVTFGGLAAGLGVGTIAELTRRTLGVKAKNQSEALLDASPFLTEANAKRIVDTLCKVRGAALKLGQMLSIQDNSTINPQLQRVFERVRQSADFMPTWQLERTLVKEFGPDWRRKFLSFDDRPFAAASIGQVHQAMLYDGRSVAMKIQYPGVAEGIESDINNLISTLTVANILPEGLFIDSLIEVAKRELRWECDYLREKECTKKFRNLLQRHSDYYVPEVIENFCTQKVFTAELIDGIAVDKCVSLDQERRNYIASLVLKLCLMEIFQFRFMQTDPNWSNFFYNQDTNQIALLDFGACRDYSKEFVDKYVQIIHGASVKDREKVHEYSRQLGFLTGYEAKVMVDAHIDAVMILGEAFQRSEPFIFSNQDTTKRIQRLVPILMSHRMCPPPEETYSLHRKMSGVFLLCAKLNAEINCKPFFDYHWHRYNSVNN